MNDLHLSELSLADLKQINGGEHEESYDAGYAAGEAVGKMVRNFLTITGIWKLIQLL